MTVFKHFFKFVGRYKFTFLIYGIIFVLMVFALAKDTAVDEYEVNAINVIIDDRANDKVSDAIKKYFKNDNITFEKMSDADKQMAVAMEKAQLIVTINENAEEFLKTEPKKAISVYNINHEVGEYGAYNLSQFVGYLKQYDFDFDKANEMMNVSSNVIMEGEKKTSIDLRYLFVFGGFILTSMLMFNISLVNASLGEGKFFKRTIASPIGILNYNTQIFLAQSVVAIIMNIFMVGTMAAVIPEVRDNILITAFNFIIYSISILGIVNLLTAISDKKSVVVAVANVFSMLLATTGGAFIPFDLLPKWMINVGKVFPFYYFGQNADVYTIDKKFIINILIMLAMGAFYFILCGIFLKKKRRME